MQNLNWEDLRILLAIGRGGSLAEAARRLAVNETTVSRRLSRLERALDTRLFLRSKGRLIASDSGQLALDQAEKVEREVAALESVVTGQASAAAGQVRLTAVPLIVNRVLVPALPRLWSRHPRLQLELIAEPRDLSLTKRDADIALRLARPRREPNLLSRRLGDLPYGIFAAPNSAPDALPWITYDSAMAALPQARWIAARVQEKGEQNAMLRVNDAEAALQAVKAGLGKSLLPLAVADQEPGLAAIEDGKPTLSREVWLLVHPDLRHLARIAAVIEWLEELLSDPREVSP